MRRLFADLATQKYLRGLSVRVFAEKAAHFMGELNAIHPFREGNGRMQLTFPTLLAEQVGHPLILERLDPAEMLAGMIASFQGKEESLARIVRGLTR